MKKMLGILAFVIGISCNSFSQATTITIDATCSKTGSALTLTATDIISFSATNRIKGTTMSVYTLNPARYPAFDIHSGWGFDGNCIVYGTFITGNDGTSIFTPCKNCVGFPAICGPGLCKLSFSGEKK